MQSDIRQIVFDKLTKFVSDFEEQNNEKAPLAICQKCYINGPDPKCSVCKGTRVFLTDADSDMFKKCDKCNGQGFRSNNGFITFCGQCEGKGYVDWITEMIGSLREDEFSNVHPNNGYSVTGVTGYSGSMTSCYGTIPYPQVSSSPTPPTQPATGQVYYNTKNNKLKIFDGKKWVNTINKVKEEPLTPLLFIPPVATVIMWVVVTVLLS